MLVACALAVTASPVAFAAWSTDGSIEPDYAADVTDGFMFANPDVNPSTAVKSVYFNVVTSAAWTNANPNVGATGSRMISYPAEARSAFIGVWKDCNDDGYVGLGEGALFEYPVALLGSDDICEAGTSDHNDGTTVREFLWIVDADAIPADRLPAKYIDDDAVTMWGLLGLPPKEVSGGGDDNSCFVNPPVGFGASTGSMLDFGDCLIGHAIANAITDVDNGEFCVVGVTAEWICPQNGTEAPGTGLGFGDSRYPNGDANARCSASPLNQEIMIWGTPQECPNRWGGSAGLITRGSQDDATFTVWDCPSGDLNPQVHATPDDRGSLYESVNNTAGFDAPGDCQDSKLWDPALNQEAAVESGTSRVSSDYDFNFYPPGICSVSRRANNIEVALPVCVNPPTALGSVGTAFTRTYSGAAYLSRSAFLAITPPNVEVRGSNVNEFEPDGESPFYMTFYAKVSATGLTLPSTKTGVYGKEFCGDNEQGTFNGWNCDASQWYAYYDSTGVASDGSGATGPACTWIVEREGYLGKADPCDGNARLMGAIPGDSYNLRDIDCYDGSAASSVVPGAGVGAGSMIDEENGGAVPTGPCEQVESLI